ncbi:MAG: transporter [Ignavibacteriaceae bacterium]
MKLFVLVCFIYLMFTSDIFSQTNPDLITDRPDKTESASVVPQGTLQIESGFEYFSDNSIDEVEIKSFSIAGTLFRYGLFKNTELRLGGSFLSQKIESNSISNVVSGLTDFMFGAKYEFINDHHSIPDIALMLHFFLPAGAKVFKPTKTEPQVILSLAKGIDESLDLGVNLGSQHNSEEENLFYFYTLAAGFGITDTFGLFIEIYSEILSNSSPLIMAGAGFTYMLLYNLQLDISGGNGLFNNSKVWYFGAGVSVRLPR